MKEIKLILQQAQILQQNINELPGTHRPELADSSTLTLEQIVTDKELYTTVAKLFHDGHHAEAVKKAYLYLNNLVKKLSQSGGDGAGLMRNAFNAKKPALKLNAMSNSSEVSEQQGYMDIYAGVMTGIRNPRAHEHDWEDTEGRALQLLSLANHLVLRAKASKNPSASSNAKSTTSPTATKT